MSDAILRRIVRDSRVPDLVDLLSERLAASDLSSLLLEVFRRRAQATRPADLLARRVRDRLVQPSEHGALRFVRFDAFALGRLPEGFEALELSPVPALGTCAAVATVDQNKVVSALRNLEVAADSTNALAIECALRRRSLLASGDRAGRVRLAASQRLVRAQRFEGANMWPHFRVLALCTAGRDAGLYGFEADALVEHAGYYLRLLAEASELGAAVAGAELQLNDLSDGRMHDALERVAAELAASHPSVSISRSDTTERGRGYYRAASFQLRALSADGAAYELCDGGAVDWTASLLANRKERLVVSGFGVDRFLSLFGGD